jgi:hypothetical protein
MIGDKTMRTNRSTKTLIASALGFILLVAATACGQTSENVPAAQNAGANTGNADTQSGNRYGQAASTGGNQSASMNLIPSGELSEAEVEGLLYMREEEKLARDVYLALYDAWGLPVFSNIAQSEATHMEAVLTLINGYGLDDPAATRSEGEFTNPDLQALYDQLVAQGEQSLADALRVGAAIEEIDILDLADYIAQTDKQDIITVYNNLMNGSQNHLRAFVTNLERQTGETYVPQYLDNGTYTAIMNTTAGQGGWGKGGRGTGQGGNPNWGNP